MSSKGRAIEVRQPSIVRYVMSRLRTVPLVWLALLALFGACAGQPDARTPTPKPSGVIVSDFLTAVEAIRLATERVPGANGIFGVSVSFPRSEGKAEFWTIDLAHPDRPQTISRIQIQGRRVVSVSDVPAEGGQQVPADAVKVDSSQAADKVQSLSWYRSGDEVTMAPQVLRIGDGQIPAAKDRAFWHLIVVQPGPERSLRGVAWIAADTGDVLFECHPPDVAC